MWQQLVRILILSGVLLAGMQLAYSQELSSPQESVIPQLSKPVIEQLEKDKLQLQNLKQQIQGYNQIFQVLLPQLDNLSSGSTIDSELSTQLINQLSSSQVDSKTVQTLSTKLSSQFQTLSASYKMAKLVNKIAVPTAIVAVLAVVTSVVTKGFTRW